MIKHLIFKENASHAILFWENEVRQTGGNEERFNEVSPVRPGAYRKHHNKDQRTCHNHTVHHWQEWKYVH